MVVGVALAALLCGCTTSTNNSSTNTGTTMEASTAETNKASVRAFFTALENEDVNALVALFAENAQHINPYASGLFPEGASGRDGIRAYWTPVFPNFDGMAFPIEELYAMENPNIVYVKYRGRIALKNNAGHYENDYYSTFKFNEAGLITEYVEIFNPIVAARGFGLLDQIQQAHERFQNSPCCPVAGHSLQHRNRTQYRNPNQRS